MPGVDRECTTHHHACDCREAKFAALEAENERLVKRLQAVRREARRQIRGDGIRVEYRHAMQVAGRHILVILEHKQA